MTEGQETRKTRQPNRLVHEQSPYLLQHAYNPVDWYPWGDEALARARAEDRPILLSIGYSACHWCHVMERECFEDPEIAGLMNRNLVCVKVDREERPDLDHVYQQAAQLLGAQGGWPLTVFLTPQCVPFYAGTYFPPAERFGMPAFPRVVETVCRIYREDRARVEQVVGQVQAGLRMLQDPVRAALAGRGDGVRPPGPGSARALVEHALRWLDEHADRQEGGFGSQPKFPNVPLIRLFLAEARYGQEGREDPHVRHALLTLDKILAGGIHDQLGGAFHRYSTDRRWRVPHFEKMLYDNAQIPLALLEAYQLTGEDRYRTGAERALEYLLQEMRHPEGGFYTSQDADAGGVEGGTFLWTPGEIRAVLDPDQARLAEACFGVTSRGDLEGRSVLHRALEPEEAARRFGLPAEEVARRLEEARRRLLEARGKRVQPERDDKVLAGWNGLAIVTFARAGAVLGEVRFVEAARQALDFVLRHLVRPDGGLLRSYRTHAAPIPGHLEDHAYLAWGCLELYQATFEPACLQAVRALAEAMVDRFWDAEGGGFFLSPPPEGNGSGDALVFRPKEATDQSLPAPAAAAGWALLALHSLMGEDRWRELAGRLLQLYRPQMAENPWGSGSLLLLLEVYESGWHEVTVAAPPGAGAGTLRPWLEAVHGPFAPDRLAAGTAPLRPIFGSTPAALPASWSKPLPEPLPVLEGKAPERGRVRGFLCRRFTCTPPLASPEELRQRLAGTA
ncbi:thioredoxin domain-containing protein [Limnochorda pilosa]|uniref:Thioredoxin n=1 Tax=Limnochorda pilosa TaxID=1555112 RepID=A0A0K2SIL9_LIMPI|nr:thioredoxin domain-containing protein [Limnochorda pilosa]BAS26958.1 thioredoxin [Limnochorda pilosa]